MSDWDFDRLSQIFDAATTALIVMLLIFTAGVPFFYGWTEKAFFICAFIVSFILILGLAKFAFWAINANINERFPKPIMTEWKKKG